MRMSDPEERTPQNGGGANKPATQDRGLWTHLDRFASLFTVLSVAGIIITTIIGLHTKWGTAAVAIAAGALAAATAAVVDVLRKQPAGKRPEPDDRIRRRVEEISTALKQSAGNLGEASVLLTELQEELTGRVIALERLRQEIAEHERLAEISSEASKALDQVIDARMREQARRIARVAWGQGLVFAIFGAAVAVAVVVFSHWLPTIR
jgi:hypothetical protein